MVNDDLQIHKRANISKQERTDCVKLQDLITGYALNSKLVISIRCDSTLQCIVVHPNKHLQIVSVKCSMSSGSGRTAMNLLPGSSAHIWQLSAGSLPVHYAILSVVDKFQ